MTILPIFKPSARIKDRSPAAVGRASRVASRVSRRRSAVSGAAPAERDFRRRNEDEGKEEEEEEEDFAGFISSAPDTSAAWPGVTSGRSFSYSSVATVGGTLSFASTSASTIVFGILRLDPLTAAVVLITAMPFTGFAESGGFGFALASTGKSVSTSSDFEERTASLPDSCCTFRPTDFGSLLAADSGSLESSSDSAEASGEVPGAELSSTVVSVLALAALAITVARFCFPCASLPWTSMMSRYGSGSRKAS